MRSIAGRSSRRKTSFQLAAGAETKFPFDIKLKNAFYGKQPIRIDFTVEAEERLQFSAYGQLEVGTKDLTLDVRSHLDKDGTLIVEQFMTNHEPHVADFKCHLRSKGYRPQRMQVYRLGREPRSQGLPISGWRGSWSAKRCCWKLKR